MNRVEAAELRALGRKLTDGLNLVHGEFAVLREERRQDRREFREFRNEMREDRKELRAEIAKVHNRAAKHAADPEAALRELTATVDTWLERRARTRRLVKLVAGITLLATGWLLRPLFERVAAALFAG